MNNIIAKVRGARASRLNLSLHRHVNYECRSPLFLGQVPDTSIYTCIYTSDVLEHKWRVILKLHYYYMIDFNF